MKWDEFKKWYNRDFWKAFKSGSIPLQIPETHEEREKLVREVYESIEAGRYSVDIPEIEIVHNKGFGVARTVPVFSIKDYIAYYFCVKELESVLAVNRTPNTFGGWTLGGKLRKKEDEDVESDSGFYDSRYSFNPRAWTRAFGEFNSLLYAQLDTGKYPLVFQYDLSNFYDSIRLDMLERWIREESDSSKGWIIALLFYFLNQWNRKRTGLHPQAVGIPQDALADCSRLLANFYLQKYDKYASVLCESIGAVYFRYSDDQMILLQESDHCERLLLLITRRLDQFGLRINQKKVSLWKKEDLENHRLRELHAIFANSDDKKNPRLVSQFASTYLAIPVEDLLRSWNRGVPALNRLLWSKIECLDMNQRGILLQRYTETDYLSAANYKQVLRIYRLIPVHKRKDFLDCLVRMSDRLVHNSFHYELLFLGQELRLDLLCDKVSQRIDELRTMMDKSDLGIRNY